MKEIDYCPVYRDTKRKGDWITGTALQETAAEFIVMNGDAVPARYPKKDVRSVQSRIAPFKID